MYRRLLLLFLAFLGGCGLWGQERFKPDIDSSSLDLLTENFYQNNKIKGYEHGFAVLIQKGAKTLLKKTFGYADINDKRKFLASDLIKVAHFQDFVIAHSILQLKVRGGIGITDKVKDHLPELRLSHNQAITISHLLTRTAGFADFYIQKYGYQDPYHKNNYINVLPPGKFPGNDSISYTLLQKIIEKNQDMPFADYARDFIFAPSGMQQTALYKYLPTNLQKKVVSSYYYRSFSEKPERMIDAVTRVRSQYHFYTTLNELDLYLANVFVDNENILKRTFHRDIRYYLFHKQFSFAPDFPGISFGLVEMYRGANQVFFRNFYSRAGNAILFFVPGQKISGFIYTNSNNTLLTSHYFSEFLKTYLPLPTIKKGRDIEVTDRLASYSGQYLAGQFRNDTIIKFLSAIYAVDLKIDRRGEFHLKPVWPKFFYDRFMDLEYQEQDPPVLYEPEKNTHIAFRMDNQGNITHFFTTDGQHNSYKRLGFWQTSKTRLWVSFAFAVYFISVSLLLLTGMLYVRRFPNEYRLPTDSNKILRHLTLTIAGLESLFIIGFVPLLFYLGGHMVYGLPGFLYEISHWHYLLFSLPVLAGFLLTLMIYLFLQSFHNNTNSRRLKYALFILLCILFNLWLNEWNLLGYNF